MLTVCLLLQSTEKLFVEFSHQELLEFYNKHAEQMAARRPRWEKVLCRELPTELQQNTEQEVPSQRRDGHFLRATVMDGGDLVSGDNVGTREEQSDVTAEGCMAVAVCDCSSTVPPHPRSPRHKSRALNGTRLVSSVSPCLSSLASRDARNGAERPKVSEPESYCCGSVAELSSTKDLSELRLRQSSTALEHQ
ncbi:hypothetical protein JZ751_001715, partial [Albula glossodonta]